MKEMLIGAIYIVVILALLLGVYQCRLHVEGIKDSQHDVLQKGRDRVVADNPEQAFFAFGHSARLDIEDAE